MKLRKLGIAVSISMIGFAIFMNYSSNSYGYMKSGDLYKPTGINDLDIRITDKTILLDVILDKPMSCEEVFDALGIEDIPLKGKTYSPACTTITPSLIVITYKERLMV